MISVRNFITWGGMALFLLLVILLVMNGLNSIELTGQVTSSIDEVVNIGQINTGIISLIQEQYKVAYGTGGHLKKEFIEISFRIIDKFVMLEKTTGSLEELNILNSLQREHEEFESLVGYVLAVESELDEEEKTSLLEQVDAKLDFLLKNFARLQQVDLMQSRRINENLSRVLFEKQSLLIAFLLALTILSVLFFFFLHKLVLYPIRELINSTRDVAQGNLDAKVHIKSNTEFGELSKSYNRMLHELKRSREEIEFKSEELKQLNRQISVFNDELEQKVSERTESLLASKAYLNQVIYSSPVAIAAFDRNGKLTDCNFSYRNLVNLDDFTANTGKITIEDVGKVASSKFNDCWAEALSGCRVRTQAERIDVGGAEKWYVYNFCPQIDEDGELVRIICYCEDVSEQIYSHEQLEIKNRELESFVYSVSHDLKSPIFTILGLLEMVRSDPGIKLTENQDRILGNIEKKLMNMRQMIGALLDLSRAGANRDKFTTFNPKEVVRLSFLEEKVIRKGREAELIIEDLPEIFADKDLLMQLFRNLFSNAFKYSNEDIPLVIRLNIKEEDGSFVFSVSDNGLGIDGKFREKVFEVFFRASDCEVEGAGVGLTIVNKIVESHGGRIWIESSEAPGTTFMFTLPKYQPEDEEAGLLVEVTPPDKTK